MDQGRKWWDAAVVATAIVVALVVWANGPARGLGGTLAVLAVILLAHLTFGRRVREGTWQAGAFQFVLIGCTIAGTWFSPNFMTVLVVVLPLVWVTSSSLRQALVLNAVTGAGTTVAFALGSGGSPEDFAQGGTVSALSIVFSIALGLWISRVHEYGAERARLLAELTAAQGSLERLNRDAGAAEERERLAREIHDTIAQSLTGLVMLAQRARRERSASRVAPDNARMDAADGTPASAADDVQGGSYRSELHDAPGSELQGVTGQQPGFALDATLELIETMAREALDDARGLVATSAVIPRSDGDLAGALGRLRDRFRRETGIEVETSVDSGALPREVEVVLLRSAQEALANVRKHAAACRVGISVAREAGMVTLTVSDDGRGLSGYQPDREQGFGISGMRDRIRLVDGDLDLADRDGGGAVLTVHIPLTGEPGAGETPEPGIPLSGGGAVDRPDRAGDAPAPDPRGRWLQRRRDPAADPPAPSARAASAHGSAPAHGSGS